MRGVYRDLKTVGLIVALGLPIVLAAPVYAQSGDISNVENFIPPPENPGLSSPGMNGTASVERMLAFA